MTVEELYQRSLALVGSSTQNDDSNREYMLAELNTALVEALPYENSVRRLNGAAELPFAPDMQSFDDEIPYSQSVLLAGVIFLLAGKWWQNDDEQSMFLQYRNMGIAGLQDAQLAAEEPIKDVYSNAKNT